MHRKKECIAMLLAGGQGSRLHSLTENNAKPAVPFGGKYKIIDFALSNCINSGINTVGVLTQYCPFELSEYIGNGEPWKLDNVYGGIAILPPYQNKKGAYWYNGTANAVFQNLEYIEKYSPSYVLILSGDQIYLNDYTEMLNSHKSKNADCTISVINVDKNEAKRFGILSTNENGKIIDFEEKPENPKSTLASMGIYIFNTDILIKYLKEDNENPKSDNDFGKNIIPKLLKDGRSIFAFEFNGYWRDVGTVESLWQSNMDLLGEKPIFNLFEESKKIYSRSLTSTPVYVGEQAKIKNSIVAENTVVMGSIENCVVFNNVRIEKNAVLKNTVVFGNTLIESGAFVDHAIIDSGTVVSKNTKVCADYDQQQKITVIENNKTRS